MKTNSRSW